MASIGDAALPTLLNYRERGNHGLLHYRFQLDEKKPRGFSEETRVPDEGSSSFLSHSSEEAVPLSSHGEGEAFAKSCRVDSSSVSADSETSDSRWSQVLPAKVTMESTSNGYPGTMLMPPPGLELPAAQRQAVPEAQGYGMPVRLTLASEFWAPEAAWPERLAEPPRSILGTCPVQRTEADHVERIEAVKAAQAYHRKQSIRDMAELQELHDLKLQQEWLEASRFHMYLHRLEQLRQLELLESASVLRRAQVFGGTSSGKQAIPAATGPVVVPPPAKSMVAIPVESGQREVPTSQQKAKRTTFAIKVTFPGFDPVLHADFDLVPRLIGRGGSNVRSISQACGGKLSIRGPGSGSEKPQSKDVLLHLLLTCQDANSRDNGKQLLLQLLDGIHLHFQRYINKKSLLPVSTFYKFTDVV